jgi:hypothetical protein
VFYLFGSVVLLGTLFSDAFGPYTSLSVGDQISHPYKTTGKINGNDSKKWKSHSGRNQEQIKFWVSLIPFSPEYSVFLSCIQKYKD